MKLKLALSFFGLLLCGALLSYLPAEGDKAKKALDLAISQVVRMESPMGSCSGTIINETVLITAAHCVPPTQIETPFGFVNVSLPPMQLVRDGTVLAPGFVVPGYVDGATMHGDFSGFSTLPVDDVNGDVFVVDRAVICGYPLFSNKLRCTEARHVGNTVFHSLFDSPGIPGMSGGAVFSLDGKLIGIISAGTEAGYTEVVSTAGMLSLEP
jgi:hypothetical protein